MDSSCRRRGGFVQGGRQRWRGRRGRTEPTPRRPAVLVSTAGSRVLVRVDKVARWRDDYSGLGLEIELMGRMDMEAW